MSLLAALPTPSQAAPARQQQQQPAPSQALVSLGAKEVPPYLRRQRFVPRKPEDFGDGGAFPEIHVAQYPLEMGRSDAAKGGKTLAVSVDADGKVNTNAIVMQGRNRDKIVHTGHGALVPKLERMSKEVRPSVGGLHACNAGTVCTTAAPSHVSMHQRVPAARSAAETRCLRNTRFLFPWARLACFAQALQRPDEEAIEEATKKTAEALNLMVTNKVAISNPSTLPSQPGGPTYIKYTPSNQSAATAGSAGQRIIKMQELPKDPLEPPKFRHTKVPRGPGSPPVPVMHSPPRPVTVQDQQNWKIPPCISNWKNPKVRRRKGSGWGEIGECLDEQDRRCLKLEES